MTQLVLVLYSGTIQFSTECNSKLTRLSAVISPYLGKFIKYNKSNAAFLREIFNTFSPIYLSEATYVIISFNILTEL